MSTWKIRRKNVRRIESLVNSPISGWISTCRLGWNIVPSLGLRLGRGRRPKSTWREERKGRSTTHFSFRHFLNGVRLPRQTAQVECFSNRIVNLNFCYGENDWSATNVRPRGRNVPDAPCRPLLASSTCIRSFCVCFSSRLITKTSPLRKSERFLTMVGWLTSKMDPEFDLKIRRCDGKTNFVHAHETSTDIRN